MSRYWNDIVHQLTPYVPGEQSEQPGLVKLNTNENPYGPSPFVLEVLRNGIDDTLRLYPDPASRALRASIARRFDLTPEHVFVGNGSDEVLAHTFRGLLGHGGPILFPDATYSFYPVYCKLFGMEFRQIPLDAQFRIDVEGYLQPNGGIVFPNPNAPTGIALEARHIERLLERNSESVVVIDEAYVDFGGESVIPLVRRFPQLLVTHTLSKSYALAGVRVGFALGHPDLIAGLDRVKDSFNSYPVDRLAQAAAAAAIEDGEYLELICSKVIASRERLAGRLRELDFEVLPSSANFVLARHRVRDAVELATELRARGVLVRHFRNPPRVAPFLRITVGTDAQCDALLESLQGLLDQQDDRGGIDQSR